jgi:hypothetical protein
MTDSSFKVAGDNWRSLLFSLKQNSHTWRPTKADIINRCSRRFVIHLSPSPSSFRVLRSFERYHSARSLMAWHKSQSRRAVPYGEMSCHHKVIGAATTAGQRRRSWRRFHPNPCSPVFNPLLAFPPLFTLYILPYKVGTSHRIPPSFAVGPSHNISLLWYSCSYSTV